MSVANVFVSDEAIMCLTDTMRYIGSKPHGLVQSKSRISTNASFAWTVRGSTMLGQFVDVAFGGEDFGYDFAIETLPYLAKDFPTECQKYGAGEIIVMGWSEAVEALEARMWRIPQGEGIEAAEETILPAGLTLKPGGREDMRLPERVNEDIMVKLALAQHKVAGKFGVSICIGGVMHLTTVTKAGVQRRIVGAYPDYKAHAKQFGCPNAAEYRAFIKNQNAEKVA